jgi:hypothetical protein
MKHAPATSLLVAPASGLFCAWFVTLYGLYIWQDELEWLYFAGVIRKISEKWAVGPFFIFGLCINKINNY